MTPSRRCHRDSLLTWCHLPRACDEALKALQAAVGAVTELKIFDLAKFEDHAARKAINKAKEKIKTSYDTFGVRNSY